MKTLREMMDLIESAQQGVAENRFDEPLTGWHIVYRKSGNPVHGTPSFETQDQAQKYLMTRMFANHHELKVVHTAGVGVAEGEKKPHPKTWHDVDSKLGKAVDKMSQAEKVKKGFAHPDTLKKKKSEQGVAEEQVEESTPDALAKIEDLFRK